MCDLFQCRRAAIPENAHHPDCQVRSGHHLTEMVRIPGETVSETGGISGDNTSSLVTILAQFLTRVLL